MIGDAARGPEPARPDASGAPEDDARRLRLEAVRRTVEHALSATSDGLSGARSTGLRAARAQTAVVEELGSTIGRMRGALDDLSAARSAQASAVLEELQQAVGRFTRTLDGERTEGRIAELEARVAALEARLSAAGGPGT